MIKIAMRSACRRILLLIAGIVCPAIILQATEVNVQSPDGRLSVVINDEGGQATYRVFYDQTEVVQPSALGLQTSLGDFSTGLHIVGSHRDVVTDHYKMTRVKASDINYQANRLDVTFFVEQGKKAADAGRQPRRNQTPDSLFFTVRFQLSDNNVAFRYLIPRPKSDDPKRLTIYREATAFSLPEGTTTFLSPQIGPESGWQQTKPSYEEDYEADAPMNKPSRFGQGYTFPCLFNLPPTPSQGGGAPKKHWLLIGETGVSSAYCGSHLSDYQPTTGYQVAFPNEGENNSYGTPYATIPLPGVTPWRTLTIGSTLKPIVETTIAYDVVEPLYAPRLDYKPGRYTWSWLIWQDTSINYDDQVKFIDLAAAMGYEYCLVDNWWDKQIGRDRIEQLSRYAQSKGVSLLLWYNSNGFWNDAPQTPRDCMNTAIAREREMQWLESIGVKGIKVDFFGGDKQQTMQLYEDILSDANRHGLQVVFHGCTIPRGWERMYPNYVASEAALASENVFFSEGHARTEGFELTMHPFCRNALGAFDWGGVIMNRYLSPDNKSRHPRHTTDVFEMASAFTNQTSVQCVAMQPNNLLPYTGTNDGGIPQFEIDFLKTIPTTWDETRFLDGYPTRYVVLARRHGDRWYVAGLNGTDQPLTLELNLSTFFSPNSSLTIYNDNPRKSGQLVPNAYVKPLRLKRKGTAIVTLQPMGGFIIVSE